jgi:hypothetical protein
MRRMIRALRNTLLFLVAFTLGCAVIGRLLPPPQIPTVTPKLEWLARHGDDYDVLFFGSSRTFREIMPEVFDAEMAAAGQPVRSFNVGVDGMRPPEDTYLLEQVLALRTKRLRFVIVECNPIRFKQREDDRNTLRAVYWHDWTRLATIARIAFFADSKKRSWSARYKKISTAWPDFADHLEYWMWNASHLGRGHELLRDWLRPEPAEPLSKSDLGRRGDGFKPAFDLEQMPPSKRAAYETELAAMLARPDPTDYADPVSQEELRVKQRLIKRAGGQMVLVVPPYVGELIFHAQPGTALPPELDFCNPTLHPELFAPEHRADAAHTNTEGSKIYTRLIVQGLLEQLRKETAPSVGQ